MDAGNGARMGWQRGLVPVSVCSGVRAKGEGATCASSSVERRALQRAVTRHTVGVALTTEGRARQEGGAPRGLCGGGARGGRADKRRGPGRDT